MTAPKPSGRTMITLGVSVTPELKARIPRLPNGLQDQEWLRAAIMEKLESNRSLNEVRVHDEDHVDQKGSPVASMKQLGYWERDERGWTGNGKYD